MMSKFEPDMIGLGPGEVIMSSGLEDRLDFGEHESVIKTDVRIDPSCEFVFEDYSVEGQLLCFVRSPDPEAQSSYALTTSASDACKLLKLSNLKSFRVFVASNDTELVSIGDVGDVNDLDVNIQWQPGMNAIVTLTFSIRAQ